MAKYQNKFITNKQNGQTAPSTISLKLFKNVHKNADTQVSSTFYNKKQIENEFE